MTHDELRQPLKRLSLARRLWRKRPPALACASAAILATFAIGGVWLSRIPAPLAGQPVVIAAIPEQAEIITSSTTPADGEAPEDTAENPEDVIDQSSLTLDGTDDAPPDEAATAAEPAEQQASVVYAPHRPLRKAPIADVTEKTDQGPLPRISASGRKPFDAYAQVTPLAASTSGQPRIALVLGGMGLNTALTQKAIEVLPGDVTLGFAPYGEDLQAQVNAARASGHEILLQLPMEPVGYPATNPGPSTLLTGVPPEKNIQSLKWLMSRFAGYAGVTNYLGGRLLASEDALKPVLKELKARGLVYLEDASINMSLSPALGKDVKLPVRQAAAIIDANPAPEAIQAALERLEQQAASKGLVIATGSGLDVTIETVAEWAKTLQEKGILLVPVSASYKGRAS